LTPLSLNWTPDTPTSSEASAETVIVPLTSITRECRPLVVEIGRMLDPIPTAVNQGAIGRPADTHPGAWKVGAEHGELIRETPVPIYDDPAPAQACVMRKGNPGISTRAPAEGIRDPVPHDEPVPRAIQGQSDVTARPVDPRLIQVRIRVCFDRARARFVADDGVSGGPAHPDEQSVVLALVQPGRAPITDGPASARSLGHCPNVNAANHAAVADIGVVRGRGVVREGEG
jgi:hypothetical protein